MSLCLAGGIISLTLGVQVFTLAWTHSIEKTRWEEDWQVLVEPAIAGTDAARGLHLVAARIRGSGAGMEPPADAVLIEGAWHYRPVVPTLARLTLANSTYTADYELCLSGACRKLADLLPTGTLAATVKPGDDATITLTPCAP